MRIIRTRTGARIVEGDVVLSEILNRPGASDTLFDVLAACVAMLAHGPKMGLLGFAGGGMIAPLRAMGYAHPVEAVDLSRAGEPIFRELSEPWAGRVKLTKAEASRWLRRRKTKFDVIVEDLSCDAPAGTTKPAVSYEVLPALIRRKLNRNGLAIFNLLPVPGISWSRLYAQTGGGFRHAQVVHLGDYENRLVIAGKALEPAPETSRRLRRALCAIGSSQADTLSVRTLCLRSRA